MGLQFGVSYKGGDYEYVRVRRWPFSIGRHPGNDLCLANSSLISRRHVRITRTEDGYRLLTLGRNPTYVNGRLVAPDQPVPLEPGDRIELPDYLLEIRAIDRPAEITATVNVEAVSNSIIVIRRVASELGTSRWTADAIHEWLRAGPEREIWIRHHPVALCLPGRIDADGLKARLTLFDALIADLDPQALEIEVVNPLPPIRARS